MKKFISLGIVLFVLSSPVLAMNEINVTIDTGPHTGQIKTVAQEFRYSLASPRALASGQASRVRSHEPVVIIKPVDSASPFFRQAVINGRLLPSVLFEFTRTINGRQQVYQTVKLTNAIVSAVSAANTTSGESHPTEQISFVFEKIEYEHMQGKTAATDSWKP